MEEGGTTAVICALCCSTCCIALLSSPFIVALMKARDATFEGENKDVCTNIAEWLEELMWIVLGNMAVVYPLAVAQNMVSEDTKKLLASLSGCISFVFLIVISVWYVLILVVLVNPLFPYVSL